jgi:cytochrome b involved in lipid metabolism
MQEIKKDIKEKCIVTIDGKNYDMTEWQYKHPGGNVFKNGENMTMAFIANHGKDFNRLGIYETKEVAIKTEIVGDGIVHQSTATQLVDRTDHETDAPKPFSLDEIDKALADDIDDL